MRQGDAPIVWVLTDGKAGDEQPLIGLAEAMGVQPLLRHVSPRPLYAAMMPFGPIDPRQAPSSPGSPIAPPFPDICLAAGRRAVAYLRALKKASPQTYTVFFRDPHTRRHGADLLVVQAHDRVSGNGVLEVITAPHRLGKTRLDAIRANPPEDLVALPHPRLAVLVGGNSRHHHYDPDDCAKLVEGLRERKLAGASLMITASRRTPDRLRTELAALASEGYATFWNGAGDNPLARFLALADEVVVTADSTNMIGEAAVTGRPIQIFYPTGGHPKFDRFIDALSSVASIGQFPGAPATSQYLSIDCTPVVAAEILARFEKQFR